MARNDIELTMLRLRVEEYERGVGLLKASVKAAAIEVLQMLDDGNIDEARAIIADLAGKPKQESEK